MDKNLVEAIEKFLSVDLNLIESPDKLAEHETRFKVLEEWFSLKNKVDFDVDIMSNRHNLLFLLRKLRLRSRICEFKAIVDGSVTHD